MIQIKVTVTGAQELVASLGSIKKKMADLTPAMAKARVLMLSSVNRNFDAGGRPAPWKPLAASTIRQKARLGGSSKILIGAGHYSKAGGFQTGGGSLKRSITGKIYPRKLTIGTSIPYARIHQFGGAAGRGHSAIIPKRPYLLFQREDVKNIKKLIEQHVMGKGGAGA